MAELMTERLAELVKRRLCDGLATGKKKATKLLVALVTF
jgi:hypothetical protein